MGKASAYPCRDILRRLRDYGFEIDLSGQVLVEIGEREGRMSGSHAIIYCEDNPRKWFSFYCADDTDYITTGWLADFAKKAGMTEIIEPEKDHGRRKKEGRLSKPCP